MTYLCDTCEYGTVRPCPSPWRDDYLIDTCDSCGETYIGIEDALDRERSEQGPRPDDLERPEDRKLRMGRKERGRKHAAEFVADHSADMVRLIAVYGDGDAEDLLLHLREMFWAELWQPKGNPDGS